ncbi:MAG: hypothetical protein DDT32_00693 [Syntrophomonadaceae bacterium]|nr:hypothetical protein [Bacillota bacterium]
MPDFFNVKRIEFVITKKCSGWCEHCSVITTDRNPDNSYADFDKLIEAVQVVVHRFSVASMMTYGGEPLLYPEITSQLHHVGLLHKIPSRELITNGFFSKESDRITSVANILIKSGVNKIFLSVDSFHQEHIPIEYVELFINSMLKVGFRDILLHPAWLISPKSDNDYNNNKTWEIINSLQQKYDIASSKGNVIVPAGLSRENLRQYYENIEFDLSIRCGEIPFTNPLTDISNLRFLPNGNVNICRGLTIGNIFSDSIDTILEKYNPFNNSITSMILNGGIKKLTEYLSENGIVIDASQYYGLCDFCSDCIKSIHELRRDK